MCRGFALSTSVARQKPTGSSTLIYVDSIDRQLLRDYPELLVRMEEKKREDEEELIRQIGTSLDDPFEDGVLDGARGNPLTDD